MSSSFYPDFRPNPAISQLGEGAGAKPESGHHNHVSAQVISGRSHMEYRLFWRYLIVLQLSKMAGALR